MSDKSTKHENFKRMADLRARKIAKSLQVLSNLASYNYEFHAHEVDKLFDFIQEQVGKSRAKFDARLNKATERANRDSARLLDAPTKPWSPGDLGVADGDDEIDDERYPVISEGLPDHDLGENTATPSPQTSLPGPSEADIEQETTLTPGEEEPWGNDEPAGPEMELADAGPSHKTHRKR